MKIRKLAVVAALIPTALLPLAACGSDNTSSTSKESTQEKPDLTGTWKQAAPEDPDNYQEAAIQGDTITINWVTDGGKTKSLYWSGSFQAPEKAGEHSWESKNDKSQTDGALLASSDDTKKFTYKDNKLSYEASAMGTTTTIELEKQ